MKNLITECERQKKAIKNIHRSKSRSKVTKIRPYDIRREKDKLVRKPKYSTIDEAPTMRDIVEIINFYTESSDLLAAQAIADFGDYLPISFDYMFMEQADKLLQCGAVFNRTKALRLSRKIMEKHKKNVQYHKVST